MSHHDIHVNRQGGRWSNAQQDGIGIVDYDVNWPALYDAEARRLREGLPRGPGFTLDHIGSTAVPGLAAKPVIDMLLTLDDTTIWPRLIEPLHVRVSGDGVAEMRFRDYLRRHADEAERYAALKRSLAAAHATDRDAYTEGKAGFVQRIRDVAAGR